MAQLPIRRGKDLLAAEPINMMRSVHCDHLDLYRHRLAFADSDGPGAIFVVPEESRIHIGAAGDVFPGDDFVVTGRCNPILRKLDRSGGICD